jgi:preprotein translocase subunit YajC
MHFFTPVNIALISLSCIFILLSALFFGFFFLINFKNKKNLKKIRELIERFNVLSNNKIAKNLR